MAHKKLNPLKHCVSHHRPAAPASSYLLSHLTIIKLEHIVFQHETSSNRHNCVINAGLGLWALN